MNLLLQAQAQGGGSMSFLIMMVAIFAIMWFFMIRPQQKKQKEIRKFQNSLQEGSKVVTGGGVYWHREAHQLGAEHCRCRGGSWCGNHCS